MGQEKGDTVPASQTPLSRRKLLSPATLFIFFLEVLALASFLWHQGLLELFSRVDHSLIFLQHIVYLREIGPAIVLASLAGFLCLHGLFLSRIHRQFPGKIF